MNAKSNTSCHDILNRNIVQSLSYSAVASANTIPVHLHVHTNSTRGIILTGMCVASGTMGETAEETEGDRRFGTKETLHRCTLTNIK